VGADSRSLDLYEIRREDLVFGPEPLPDARLRRDVAGGTRSLTSA
jgi:hypothetical protein